MKYVRLTATYALACLQQAEKPGFRLGSLRSSDISFVTMNKSSDECLFERAESVRRDEVQNRQIEAKSGKATYLAGIQRKATAPISSINILS